MNSSTDTLNFSTPFLVLPQTRLSKFLRWMKRLNLFKKIHDRTEDGIKRQTIATRAYLFLLTGNRYSHLCSGVKSPHDYLCINSFHHHTCHFQLTGYSNNDHICTQSVVYYLRRSTKLLLHYSQMSLYNHGDIL